LSNRVKPHPEAGEHYSNEAKEAAREAKASQAQAATSAGAAADERALAEVARANAQTAQTLAEAARSAAETAQTDAEEEADRAEVAAARAVAAAGNLDKVVMLEKRVVNLEQGITPDPYHEDSAVAFAKTVPSKALPYAQIGAVGGMTYKVKEPNPAVRFEFDCEEGEFGAYTGLTYNATEKTVTLDTSLIPDYVEYKTVIPSVHMFTEIFHGVGLELGKTYTIGYSTNNPSNYMCPDGTFVFTEDIANDIVSFYAPEGGIATFTDIVLVEGTTADTEVDVLHDTKVTAIESRGKNLLKVPPVGSQHVIEQNAESVTVACGNANGYQTGFSLVLPAWLIGKTVTISGSWKASANNNGGIRVLWRNGKQNLREAIGLTTSGGSKTATLTKPDNADGLNLYVYSNISGTAVAGDTVTYTDVQLELGDTATPFTPYREPITFPIPAEVQALDGYGWGISADVYNGVEWDENGKATFVKRVERKVFDGTESWWNNTTDAGFYVARELADVSPTNKKVIASRMTSGAPSSVGTPCVYFSDVSIVIFPGNLATTAAEWKAKLAEWAAEFNPLTVYYELAEPVVTDISHLVSADNFIGVEPGGTITVQNERGDAAPSTVVYQLKPTEV
jgi:hypothetical protein